MNDLDSNPDPITPAGFDSLPTRRTRKPPRTVTSIILLILGLGLAISSFTVQIVFLGGFDTLETEARQAKTMDESMGAGFAGIAVVVILPRRPSGFHQRVLHKAGRRRQSGSTSPQPT